MSLYQHFYGQLPGYGLSDALDEAAGAYSEAFADTWGLPQAPDSTGLPAEQWESIRELHRLAAKLAVGASSLVRPPRIREDQLRLPAVLEREAATKQAHLDSILSRLKAEAPQDLYEELSELMRPVFPQDPRTKRNFLQHCMELEAYRFYNVPLEAEARRMLRLSGVMVRHPGEFTRAYLTRVAACYVRDMPAELAVMCRAVLDAAIQELLTDEEVRAAVGASGDVVLERRIAACRAREWFDQRVEATATRIRERGRDAAHFTPGLEGTSDEMIDDLAVVLKTLEEVKPR